MGACVSLIDRLDAAERSSALAGEQQELAGAALQLLSSDELPLLAAQHWLTLEQLHHLHIARQRQLPGLCSTCAAFCHLPSCSTLHSPAGSPCLPPQPAELQQLEHFLLEQSIPAASPADLLGSAADISEGQAVWRSGAERAQLFSSRVRPLLRDALLLHTELAADAVSLVLEFLVQPPQLSGSQRVLLALLTSQHLTDCKLEEQERQRQRQQQPQPQEPPAFSDLLLTEDGDWTHRSGVIDRRASLQANALRLNFATLRTGRWSVAQLSETEPADASALLLDTACVREFFFDQELFADRSRRRRLQLRILPSEQRETDRQRDASNACWSNGLITVCGDGIH